MDEFVIDSKNPEDPGIKCTYCIYMCFFFFFWGGGGVGRCTMHGILSLLLLIFQPEISFPNIKTIALTRPPMINQTNTVRFCRVK